MHGSCLASIIVGSYNQIQTLPLLLASLDRQTQKDFEVWIADDGSTDGTRELFLNSKERSASRTYPIYFITQEDQGFRKSKILNQAIRDCHSDYLIFVDGDVILEKHFIQDHLTLRQKGHFVCGRRVDVGPQLTQKITLHDVMMGRFDRLDWRAIWSWIKRDTEYLKRGIRMTHPLLRKLLGYQEQIDLLGSNFGAWKADIVAINGFNEEFETYWGEDGDLYIRLRNSGKQPKGAKSMCVQYHLFHDRRIAHPKDVKNYDEMLKNTDYKWAVKGLSNEPVTAIFEKTVSGQSFK